MASNMCHNCVISFVLIMGSLLSQINCFILKGIALESHPFIIKDGNQYEGYVIDVLNAMRNISDLNYYLRDSKDSTTFSREMDPMSHLIRELWSNSADFGVSNITITKERQQWVDFTDPLLNYSVSALIHKSHAKHIKTFNQLADQTRITYGSLRNGSTMRLFDTSDEMVIRRMYALMNSAGVPVDDLREAVRRVRHDRYAYIDDTMTVQTLARGNCDLTVIADNRPHFQRRIAIALPKGSNTLPIFNRVIKQLTERDIIPEIAQKYWGVVCAYGKSYALTPNTWLIQLICVVMFAKYLLFK